MFGPIRGDWPDTNWKGWWGDNPPYHVPAFILTHHSRPPIEMEGDTTFHFITGGVREALDRAREAAAGMNVRIGGGPGTIQQCPVWSKLPESQRWQLVSFVKSLGIPVADSVERSHPECQGP